MSTTLDTLRRLISENTPDLNIDTDTIHIQIYSYLGILKISDISVRRDGNFVNIQSTINPSEHSDILTHIIELSNVHYTPNMATSYKPNITILPPEVYWGITYFPLENVISVECTTSNKSIGMVSDSINE